MIKLPVKMGEHAVRLPRVKEPLNQSAEAVCESFFATARRDFAGIIVFISRNHNEVVTKNIRRAPRARLFRGS